MVSVTRAELLAVAETARAAWVTRTPPRAPEATRRPRRAPAGQALLWEAAAPVPPQPTAQPSAPAPSLLQLALRAPARSRVDLGPDERSMRFTREFVGLGDDAGAVRTRTADGRDVYTALRRNDAPCPPQCVPNPTPWARWVPVVGEAAHATILAACPEASAGARTPTGIEVAAC